MRLGRLAALGLLVPALAHAERPSGVCIEVNLDFLPTDALQIVAWIEQPSGTYVDTLYITQKTGRFGMGNRPGRADFNTGSLMGDTFPYGRRDQTFPVWAHRHGHEFPLVVFQNGDDDNLSHPFAQSSPEDPPPYCRPIQPTEMEFDAGTCASAAFTDKGMFSMFSDERSLYPPRSDLQRRPEDSPSVDLFRATNPFDSVSRATPLGGVPATASWAAPQRVDFGSYVLFVETSKTYDFNLIYNDTTFPSPTGIPWAEYGMAWRGQPSVVYSVPFTIAMTETSASTDAYIGYSDPGGQTGTLHPPDSTITTTTPGSGASRMQLVSDNGSMYRVRVRVKPDFDATAPAAAEAPELTNLTGTTATIAFPAPGDDGTAGMVTGYEIRVRAGGPITAENFADATPIATLVTPVEPGSQQRVDLTGLLPETDYSVGIRPYDNCFNQGPLTVVSFTTPLRQTAEVDWCFVATAAYGSVLANDVTMLRRFRDSVLESSVFGEVAILTYYTFGPSAAGLISESELLRASARAALSPIISWIRGLAY
ncbi:MAG TPA: fibronectin type III domain-containing protein [Kofleriaceae bacterium]